jgi:hypothetical protein
LLSQLILRGPFALGLIIAVDSASCGGRRICDSVLHSFRLSFLIEPSGNSVSLSVLLALGLLGLTVLAVVALGAHSIAAVGAWAA